MYEALILEKNIYAERQTKLAKTMQELENEILRIEKAKNTTIQDNKTNIFSNSQIRSQSNLQASKSSHNTNIRSNNNTNISKNTVSANNTIYDKSSTLPGTQLPIKLQFSWPVDRNQIIDVAKTKENQPTAIIIKINPETEIKAAENGKVMFKGPLGALGNVVIITHKQGFNSVYGYLDDVWVGLGQEVEKQETIGRILGIKNNKLYFEIRLASRNLDPLTLLPRLK